MSIVARNYAARAPTSFIEPTTAIKAARLSRLDHDTNVPSSMCHEAAKAELKSLVITPDLERLGPHGRKPAARPLVRGSSIQPWQPHVPDEPSGPLASKSVRA